MRELTGKISGLNKDYITGDVILSVSVNEKKMAFDVYKQLKNEDTLSFKVSKYKEHRSIDANNYAWALIGKIADHITASKDEVYLKMLKRYGQTFICKIPNKMIPVFKMQNKYCEEHEKLFPENDATYFRVYVGSSNYSTYEMSVFIKGIISEAEEMGIPTETPDELANMLSLESSEGRV